MTLFDYVKTALRLMTDDGNVINEINGLIYAGIADLKNTAGVNVLCVVSPEVVIDGDEKMMLIAQAIATYVKKNFGQPDDIERLERSYDMQKAQLKTASRSWND